MIYDHSALSFPVHRKSSVNVGNENFQNLQQKTQTTLISLWAGVKLLVLNECFSLPVQWLYAVIERVQSIFSNYSTGFGSLIVILRED